VGQWFKVPRKHQKTLVGCGAAAGIAATFNAPIAGVLFALEILLGEFGVSAFSPVVISSVMATTISRHYFGDFPAFIIPAHEIHSLWEFLIYPFLGLLCGLVSVAFVYILYKSEDIFDDYLKIPDFIKPAVGGFLLGLILLQFPHVFGVGYGGINLALTNQLPTMMLLALCLVKILATSITIGSGGSGGVFAPSLFIGAMTGGFFGSCAGMLFPDIVANPGTYALVAMGALVAGTTHAPITAILIIFELTGDYKIILPLMVCCIISTLLAIAIKRGSIYTIKLKRRGVDLSGGMEQNILQQLKVKNHMSSILSTINEGATLDLIMNMFKKTNVSYLHMVDSSGHLTGIISFRDIRPILDEEIPPSLIIARDIATLKVKTITPEDSIQAALRLMSSKGISQLPVIKDKESRILVGCLREKNVISAYDNEVIQREMQ
jgi:CIC family chloride channel protein